MASIEFGTNDYVEYHAGTLPLILTVPHDGSMQPEEIPERVDGCCASGGCDSCVWRSGCGAPSSTRCPVKVVKDMSTAAFASSLADNLFRLTHESSRPHMVVMNLHPSRLDANREVEEAAQGDAEAIRAWEEFHSFIEQAAASAVREHGYALMLDIHGQSHGDFIEIGYMLNDRVLDQNQDLDEYVQQSSVSRLAHLNPGTPLTEIIRGEGSLGSLLGSDEFGGYLAVPSSKHPGPNGARYFNGGYNTQRHGQRSDSSEPALDAIQLELPGSARCAKPSICPTSQRDQAAADMAGAVMRFLEQWYSYGLVGTTSTQSGEGTTTPDAATTTAAISTTAATITTSASTTTPGNACAGKPCRSSSHCRSKWGSCGMTIAHCTNESLWCGSDARGCQCVGNRRRQLRGLVAK